MKPIILTSIAVLALAACSDTPEGKLDEAYEGGGEDAVELVEGAPAEPLTPVETSPVSIDEETKTIDAMNEMTAAEPVVPAVETAAPGGDGAPEETGISSVEDLVGDTPVETIEGALDPVELPSAEELVEEVGGAIEEKVEEAVEDIEDTETQQ